MSQAIAVQVKFGGAMVKYAPPVQNSANLKNNHTVNVSTDTSVQMLLDDFQIPAEQPLMIILNSTMVARPDYNTTLLSDGDALSLMPPITAG